MWIEIIAIGIMVEEITEDLVPKKSFEVKTQTNLKFENLKKERTKTSFDF